MANKVGRPRKPSPPAAAERLPTVAERIDASGGLAGVCGRLRNGDTYRDIAGDLRLSLGSLFTWLADDPARAATAREARGIAAAAFDEKAQQEIEAAEDPFQLARAKELAQHLRWRASKINPRDYGDKVDVTQTVTLADLSDDELSARAKALLAIVGAKV